MPASFKMIVYVSAAAVPFRRETILALLDQSRRNNAQADITGMLLFHDGNFIQAVEGPESAVDALMQRIRRDPRHQGIIVMAEESVRERSFADWSMGFVGAEALAGEGQSNLNDFLQRPAGQPAPDGGESPALGFLKSFRRHLR
ncbi:BLUF domain-containing protein [Desertibaculum subflavum]|uniref:BLUF domain-containing protein n=1 Tax=Desertibaculum subflavum TaxID=2268458 RepID=UPI0013C3E6FC